LTIATGSPALVKISSNSLATLSPVTFDETFTPIHSQSARVIAPSF